MSFVVITAILLIVLNLILWIIFLAKFKTYFSTDDIIRKTRNQVDNIIRSVNANADINKQNLDNKIQEIRAVTAEAERKIVLLRNEMTLMQKSASFREQMAELSETGKKSSREGKSRSLGGKNKNNATFAGRYGVDSKGQGDLFLTDKAVNELNLPNETEAGDYESTASLHRIPVMTPSVYLSENPIGVEEDFNSAVKKMVEQGMTPDEISTKTGRTVQEIELAIQF